MKRQDMIIGGCKIIRLHVKRKGIYEFLIIFLLFLALWLWVFTELGVTDKSFWIVSILIGGVGSGLVLLGLWRAEGRLQGILLFIGYLLRCCCMLLDIYGRKYVVLLHSGADSETFAKHAAQLYRGVDLQSVSTKYPYVINWMYHVFGENRLCAQYVNIILWVLSAAVLIRVCNRFKVRQSKRAFIYAIWALLPTGVLLSGILLRESAEMFFGLWSFEYFLYWMQDGKRRYAVQAFVCVVPAMILHSASAALWATYIVVMMFWDVRNRRYRWQRKTFFVFLISAALLLISWETPAGALLFSKFGTDFSLYKITHLYFVQGGSDYLVDMDCQSWVAFIPDTLLRMFYFLFSPLPMDARGTADLVMFVADGLPLAVVIAMVMFYIRKRRSMQGFAYAALLGGFSFAGIFAWGVRNAGTALRHRYLS